MHNPITLVTVISRMNIGGPAILIDGLIQGLSKEDFTHHLITGRCAANEIDYLDAHPNLERLIAVHRLKSLGRTILPTKDFRTLVETIRLLKEIKPDIVHTHTSKAGIIGRIAARIASPNSTIIHTFHGHLLYGYFSPLKTKLIIFSERLLSRITDVFVAVTSQVERDLKHVGIAINGRWEVIHPGVKKIELKKITKVNRSTKHLVWIGRFTDIKNPILAVEIMDSLSKLSGPAVSLTMVGDGEHLASVQSLAEAKQLSIEFSGWQTDVYPYLQNADALLLTSKNEGLPIVMLEAASMGIPTFSTNVGGVSEFISNGSTGFIIDQTANQAAKYISSTLLNDEVINSVATTARKKYQKGFSMDSFVESHARLYKSQFN
jgi:glycosyltransferase involved in cell wall biosynthesis